MQSQKEAHASKQARTATETTRERPGAEEPSPTRRRVNNITVTTKTGDKVITASSEDTQEQDNIDKILTELIIYGNEGFDERKLKAGVNKEIHSMNKHQVFTEVNINGIRCEDRKNPDRYTERKVQRCAAGSWPTVTTR